MKSLNGSAGTGEKILDNWRLFKYKFNDERSEGNFYSYEVSFGRQLGYLNYEVNNDDIENVNLYLDGFPKPLSQNNDSALKRVALFVHPSK
ncbi:hypothetical protein ABC382_08830 [Lysinibacillus sp. 1P01SD]|uniref:hypothetical protein n=1 Tax=Lysinibacillus sp. 1P01SD TaxID=3132285 RepID=UPI0039A26D78